MSNNQKIIAAVVVAGLGIWLWKRKQKKQMGKPTFQPTPSAYHKAVGGTNL
jgi:hypothetical protein